MYFINENEMNEESLHCNLMKLTFTLLHLLFHYFGKSVKYNDSNTVIYFGFHKGLIDYYVGALQSHYNIFTITLV